MFRPVFDLTSTSVLRHEPHEAHHRHTHESGFFALVLSGGYLELGDTGCWDARPGCLIGHAPFESHRNHVGRSGASVLLLPNTAFDIASCSQISDVDAVVRLAEKDPNDALDYVQQFAVPLPAAARDWPDELANALRMDPSMSISGWAEERGLNPAVVSRGFRSVFQCSPAQYRLRAKVTRALPAIVGSSLSLNTVAHDSGFADQAHMSRAVRACTGRTPTQLRTSDPG